MALQKFTISFGYFLGLMMLLKIVSFTISFRALYRVEDGDIIAVLSKGNYHELVTHMNTAAPFANVPTSYFSTPENIHDGLNTR